MQSELQAPISPTRRTVSLTCLVAESLADRRSGVVPSSRRIDGDGRTLIEFENEGRLLTTCVLVVRTGVEIFADTSGRTRVEQLEFDHADFATSGRVANVIAGLVQSEAALRN